MRHPLEIENIDDLRRREGIDDAELREDVRRLRVGDHVKLTFLNPANPCARETLVVRITSIKGETFRGKLASPPTRAELSRLRAGSPVTFTRDQIHSIAKRQPTPGAHVGREV
jgi:hypothetical protein